MPSSREFSPFVPFDLYDFFGYLFPGILFSISIVVFYIQLDLTIITKTTNYLSSSGDINFILGLALVIGSIVVLYTLGHFIATLSHIIIDRVLLDGIEGYPVNFLLKISKPTRPFSASTFKYIFALYNSLIILPIFIQEFQLYKCISYSLLILLGLLILQRVIIMYIRHITNNPEFTREFGNKKIFLIFLLPSKYIIDPIIEFVRRLLGLDREFPDPFIKLYENLFTNRFGGLKFKEVDTENYWLPVFSVKTQNEVHDRTLHTWLHLYGYARNASAAFYLSSTLIIIHILHNPTAYNPGIRIHIGILWFLSAFMGIRYWILYSHYYTKGVIRAFVEHETNQESQKLPNSS